METAIVIGGGVIGSTIALRLREAGMAVRLIEPDDQPRGASWGNAGHVAVEQVEPLASPRMVRSALSRLYPRGPLALPPGQVAAWAPFVWRLLRASLPGNYRAGRAALSRLMAEAMPAWRRLAADAGLADLLREDGHFVVWETPATAAAGRAAWAAADTGTARIRDATVEELAALGRLTTVPIAGAIRFTGSGQITDTGLLGERLQARFAALGGVRVAARVDRLRPAGDRAVAVVGAEILEADHVVVAAGVASAALLRPLGIRVPLIAERGYHIQSASHGWPDDMPPVVFEDRSIIVTAFRSGLRVAGFVELGRRTAPPDPAKWRRLRAHVRALGLAMDLPGSEWMGARPTLPDYLPVIGRSAACANLLLAFGHNHLGLTLAPVTAEIVRALVRPDADPRRAIRYDPPAHRRRY